MAFSFAFSGDYFKLSGFLGEVERFVRVRNDDLESTGRLMLVTSFSMKTDNLLGYPKLRAEVGATSYVTPPATEIPAAEAGAPQDGAAADAGGVLTPPTTTATATGAVR